VNRLLVIQAGEIVAQGTEEELAAALGTAGEIEVALRGPAPAAIEVVRKVAGVLDAQIAHSAGHEVVLKSGRAKTARPRLRVPWYRQDLIYCVLDRGASRLESIFIELAHRERLS